MAIIGFLRRIPRERAITASIFRVQLSFSDKEQKPVSFGSEPFCIALNKALENDGYTTDQLLTCSYTEDLVAFSFSFIEDKYIYSKKGFGNLFIFSPRLASKNDIVGDIYSFRTGMCLPGEYDNNKRTIYDVPADFSQGKFFAVNDVINKNYSNFLKAVKVIEQDLKDLSIDLAYNIEFSITDIVS